MEKEHVKNRQATEQMLLEAVNRLVEQDGFEGLGINAVAAQAGVSKMLIYRYFGSLNGLIAAYIRRYDFWINVRPELPGRERLGDFIKELFRQQIAALRNNYTLRRLCRWELSTDNEPVEELRKSRESKGLWLIDTVGKLSGQPQKEIAAIATLISASISYLALLEENCRVYNGIRLDEEAGWKQLEAGIDLLVDLWTAAPKNIRNNE